MKPRRKHRRVRASWQGCRCPEGTRKVSTCKGGGAAGKRAKACRGRGWGCLGVGTSKKGKRTPRFLAAICDIGGPRLLVAETSSFREEQRRRRLLPATGS